MRQLMVRPHHSERLAKVGADQRDLRFGEVRIRMHTASLNSAINCSWVAATRPVVTSQWCNSRVHIGPSETVLTLGTGGVSMFAVQIAKLVGAQTIITSSRDEKLEWARARGADLGIDYRTFPNWETRVRELTDGRGTSSSRTRRRCGSRCRRPDTAAPSQ